MDKLIITACLTGAEVTREQQPNLPISPDEIAEAAYQAWKAGASIAHIHARKADGTPTQDMEVYREIKEKTAKKCDNISAFNRRCCMAFQGRKNTACTFEAGNGIT
jgi:3-keto-5-aminohexanoate cleavage enzyme